ncbi:MAG: glycosyltransferase family 2 protein [Parabacteroides sp.]|nr:glycosyltransferase family 2 protein [Parabacteroides sp.]
MNEIACFLPFRSAAVTFPVVHALQQSPCVHTVSLLGSGPLSPVPEGCGALVTPPLTDTRALQRIAANAAAPYTLLCTRPVAFTFGPTGLGRMLRIAADTGAPLVYADYYTRQGECTEACPLIDCQYGSLRDDFDFGPLMLFRTDALAQAVAEMPPEHRYAALYDLRLRVTQHAEPVHINEYLYTVTEAEEGAAGTTLFDYVDPRNRAAQIEMETVCTQHLRRIGGYLEPVFREVELAAEGFPCEASVIIPVRNRVRTIDDAIRSVLKQETSFPFNLIIVDNHSTDGTSEAIARYTADPRVVHLVPGCTGLGIGGCWNTGVHDARCGKFAVQLDSDDLYSDEHTLQKIVDAFYAQQCAMVVGTYRMTDFRLRTLPPGVIDHREWTPENGRNNALRINGLGAPRAFYTPLLRELNFPDTSYGEDYAVGLAVSRHYRIGRIYDVLYLCRRWEDNSDAAPDRAKTNAHNTYKDRIRTWELKARIALNRAR